MKTGLTSTLPTFVPRFVMIHGDRAPMMIAVPTVHRLAITTFTGQVIPLVFAVFTRPALAFVIANLLMMLLPFKGSMRIMMIVVSCCRVRRCS
jgi:hypothetical protein